MSLICTIVLSFHLGLSLPSSPFLHLSPPHRRMHISPHHMCHKPNHFILLNLVATLSGSLLPRNGASSGRGQRIRPVVANISHKQPRTAELERSFSWGVGGRSNISSPYENKLQNVTQKKKVYRTLNLRDDVTVGWDEAVLNAESRKYNFLFGCLPHLLPF